MKISIAMATYNGAQYIQQQLLSFESQSRLPDELVICDDASTDETVSILQKFSLQAKFNMKIIRNEHNLGYVKNFSKAMLLCKGDIVFLSDQDDVWYPEKISTIISEFEQDSSCLIIANDADICHSNLQNSGLTILGQLDNAGISSRQFVNGCCSAVRKEYLSISLPFPENFSLTHDLWLHELGNSIGVRKIIPSVLQAYRRHGMNASVATAASLKKITWYDEYKKYRKIDPKIGYLKNIEFLNLIHDQIRKCIDNESLSNLFFSINNLEARLILIKKEEKALCRRLDLYEKSRFFKPWFAIFNYVRGDYVFFRGWKSFARDIFR